MNPKENTMQIGSNTNSLVRGFRDPDDRTVHLYVGPLSVDFWEPLRLPSVHWDRTGNWKEA
jgi:hypothetical protein